MMFGSQDVTSALERHANQVSITAQSYDDYKAELIRAANAARYVVDAEGNLADAGGGVVQANYVMSESFYKAMIRARQLSAELEAGTGYLEGWAGKTRDVEAAAGRLAALQSLQMPETKVGGFSGAITGYQEFMAERERITQQGLEEIAAIEAEYSGRRYTTVAADELAIAELQHNAIQQRSRFTGAVLYGATEEARHLAALQAEAYEDSYAKQMSAAQAHSVMVSGITARQRDEQIGTVEEQQATALAKLEAGYEEQRAATRQHFGEMQTMYLANVLATTELDDAQRAMVEDTLREMRLKFGLVTQDGLKLEEMEGILHERMLDVEGSTGKYAETMDALNTASEDAVLSGEEFRGILDLVDEGTRNLMEEAFPGLVAKTGEFGDALDRSNRGMLLFEDKRAPGAAKAMKETLTPETSLFAEYAAGAANAVKGINEELDRLDGRHVKASIDIHTGGGVPSYQHGTNYVQETGLAYLHEGERVIPAAGTPATSGAGANWTGNINVYGVSDPQAAAARVLQILQDRGIVSGAALR
jgi:hypothetical protein